jgi:hypothetical protein
MSWTTYCSNGAHGVVNATGTQTALDNLEAAALSENQVACGHAHIVKGDVAMAMGRVVVAKHLEHAVNLDALGLGGHEDDRLLLVGIRVFRVRLSHDNVNGAAGVTGAARPPL